MPGARITDQLCASEVRQAGFSWDFYYPLVSSVRNHAQIANEIVALFQTEFFNRIDPKRPFAVSQILAGYATFLSINSGLGIIPEAGGTLRMAISFSSYIKQLFEYVFSSSLVLGLILGASVIVAGEGSMRMNGDLGRRF